MALVVADRVQETTSTTGTGTLTLAGAVSGFQSFAAIGDGNTTYYTIVSGTDWEVGVGTYTASGTTLSRDTVLSSSAGGATKISVASGANVFCSYPAEKSVGSQTGYFDSAFQGTFVDGVAIDYVSGMGRISVGGADDLVFYNGGVAGSELGHASSNGDWMFNGFIEVGQGTLITGAVNPLIAASASSSGYVQGYIHNDQNGTSSSADLTCYPNNGTDASGWVDMGITSLAYADTTYTCTGPNEGYIFTSAPSGSSTSGNLVFATDSTGTSNAYQWYVGGFTQAKSAYKMQLNGTNLLVKQPIQANGIIESTTGGFKFPDATTQTTAAQPFTGGTLTSELILATGTTTLSPLTFQSGTLQTAPVAGDMEYDGNVFYGTVGSSNRGVMAVEYFVVLQTTNTLTSQTAAQPLFDGGGTGLTNGALSLGTGTFFFECLYHLASMSTTSGSFGFALGGTATKTQYWTATAKKSALSTAATAQTTFNTAANTTLATASTTATGFAYITGTIDITVAGTIIPQISLGVAAAAVVQAGSYFRIRRMGSNTVAYIGNWT